MAKAFYAVPPIYANPGRGLLVQSLDVDGSGKSLGVITDNSLATTPHYLKETQGAAAAQTGTWDGLNATGLRTRPLLYCRVVGGGSRSAAIFLPDGTQITSATTFSHADWRFVEMEEYVPQLGIGAQQYEIRVWGGETHTALLATAMRSTIFNPADTATSCTLVSTVAVTDAPHGTAVRIALPGAGISNYYDMFGVATDAQTHSYLLMTRANAPVTAFAGYGSRLSNWELAMNVIQDPVFASDCKINSGTVVGQTMTSSGGGRFFQEAFSDGSWGLDGAWVTDFSVGQARVDDGAQTPNGGHTYCVGQQGNWFNSPWTSDAVRGYEIKECINPPFLTSFLNDPSPADVTIDWTDSNSDETVDHYEIIVTDQGDNLLETINPATSPQDVTLPVGSLRVYVASYFADGSFCFEEQDTTVFGVGQVIRYR